jgi:hypothetical protein
MFKFKNEHNVKFLKFEKSLVSKLFKFATCLGSKIVQI